MIEVAGTGPATTPARCEVFQYDRMPI